jgi:hypothetical protein
MTIYKKLRSIRTSITRLPGLKSYKDFDIAIEIGYHQSIGDPLTLKRLLLQDIAGHATVRRHLARMIREGTVIKVTPPNDHRTAHLALNTATIEALDQCLLKIHQTLCDSPGSCS